MQKKLFYRIFFLLSVAIVFNFCIDKDYDLGNISEEGSLSPGLPVPLGTIDKDIISFLKTSGIRDSIYVAEDSIFIVYVDSFRLMPDFNMDFLNDPRWNWLEDGRSQGIPFEIPFFTDTITGGDANTVFINLFDDMDKHNSRLLFTDPVINCEIRNYIGAPITLTVDYIKAANDDLTWTAAFKNGADTIEIKATDKTEKYKSTQITFDKRNGGIDDIFYINPKSVSYKFSADLPVSSDDLFFVERNSIYLDAICTASLPIAFTNGTEINNLDTMALDLSGSGFITDIEKAILWIKAENGFPIKIDASVLFLDENYHKINIDVEPFSMAAATANPKRTEVTPGKGDLKITFNIDQLDEVKKTKYIVLESSAMIHEGEDNINVHPKDYIKFKLEAYANVNLF